ncbi:MAG: phage tail protein, partial [Patescibacteria group bacterium]|nr:phage tail protein [Patescibacteria group bacterium]
ARALQGVKNGANFDLGFGMVGNGAGTGFQLISASSGTSLNPGSSSYESGAVWGYDSYRNAVVFTAPSGQYPVYVAYLQRQTPGGYPVSDIITDICGRVGIPAEQVDVSSITAVVQGYVITENRSAAEALADLCQVWNIDMVESDYTLKFIPRGGAPVATITQDQLATVDAKDQSLFWQEKRAQQQELPLQINVRYIDPALDYQPGAAYAKRIALPVPTVFSKRVKTVDLPIVALNVEARTIAESWLYTMWGELSTYETMLGIQFMYLDPTDNVTVTLDDGSSYTVRIQSMELGADWSMKLSLASEDQTTYVSAGTPGASVSFVPQTIVSYPFCNLIQVNIPLLQDSDDASGVATRIYYWAAPTQAMPAGAVATLFESPDGNSWNTFQTVAGFASWGNATTTLAGTKSTFATDYVNSLKVAFAPGSAPPVSCAYTDMMNGANPALVGSEIIQFQTATENADGTYTLGVLLRGQRGTDWAINSHQPGETVILLQPGLVGASTLPLDDIGTTEYWKLVPGGRFLDQTPTEPFAYAGYDLMPYAPVNFARASDGSGGLTLSWQRRTRLGGSDLQDGTDTVPLAEESEAYEAYILANVASYASFDPTNAGTYKRAFTGLTSPQVDYTAAMISADSFAASTQTLPLVVYQKSAVVGRGFAGFEAIPAF